jgi:hypothetical protein
MKKILIIFVLLSISCKKEEIKEEEEAVILDCNCDRIVDVISLSIAGTVSNPAKIYFGFITTINECSKVQREHRFSNIREVSFIPRLGQCK